MSHSYKWNMVFIDHQKLHKLYSNPISPILISTCFKGTQKIFFNSFLLSYVSIYFLFYCIHHFNVYKNLFEKKISYSILSSIVYILLLFSIFSILSYLSILSIYLSIYLFYHIITNLFFESYFYRPFLFYPILSYPIYSTSPFF